MKQVVHFGAGNIGRGFIGALFSQSGYHVTFVDLADQIIDGLNSDKQYDVKLATDQQETMTITNVSGLNNMKQEKEVIEAIKNATYLTTAIGPNILPRIAPLIAKALTERVQATDEKLYVIACENQISATDLLKGYIEENLDDETKSKLSGRIYFFNSAVDRIVPIQNNQGSLDVLVEPYFEWVVETTETIPPVEGMTIVADLAPFIERKLFTVNTGHATIAYFGYLENKATIDQTLADEAIVKQVKATLGETGAYLIKQYGLNPEEHEKYINKIINRFRNAYLNDAVTRVGRSPIRKLGPNDRLVRPATEAQKAGLSFTNLAKAIAAALLFDYKEDEEAVKVQEMIREHGVAYVLQEVSGLAEDSEIAQEVLRQYDLLKK
ncbi:mannitol-1-phosphate 5-dehydrogenase [Heyndrickxia sporothermodurans]|uniref:Mannitol-1-phosphate 5-dehydrogenase n=1 Tax=Heyndrickxia sporothermodurans TaxID=46224 RepID=A0A150LGW7_9BACI|nr:mannitol-1-phosphate 5-dehydrogenase [Heyndrickxia sporothermodurans]KYD11259.1 Mannitol-1-phosphate 5-dehydrogenase [Heyndrickxia sporothermodurans]MBL5792002.1 mannitol-1-phosphate 5-dehydrogenase [Heyndrickxia sporothermodurans]MBL5803139.1 mannitol-1-phosphate 5-dehydrogenase [Heyndrickxia sporothermodurans]MBL5807463.1 mannitol-1-phosphate 5-dehydrogenase [Heyndrickxia sporothermodurans]MBL5853121.1 mannitol-1-phosphate 5-dehydrogenase [Heyndrickxia sporothermodurans]